MYMRISSVLAFALLATACGGRSADENASQPEVNSLAEAEASVKKKQEDDGLVVCAVNGATAFSRVCQVERSEDERGLILTLRHPDGGFRRLLVTKDGRGVIAADGSEPAVVAALSDREIEVVLAGNKYRLPATVKLPQAAPAPAAAPAAPAKP
jgi:hypothetical protein